MSEIVGFKCDKCGKKMLDFRGVIQNSQSKSCLHLCQDCLLMTERWIKGESDPKASVPADRDVEGYMPHGDMSLVVCPVCGGDKFVSFPQGVCLDSPYWVWEYTCEKCGHMIGISEKRRK